METFRKYVRGRLALAEKLGRGECGGSYADGCVILAGIISGIAADLWPGKGQDRARFVETWVRFAEPSLAPNYVSVPLLVRRLRKNGDTAAADALEGHRPHAFGPGHASKVLIGPEVDLDETVIQALIAHVPLKAIRDRAYPVVFYEHVRSTLIHEAHLDDRSASVPMTDRNAGVSYVNVLTDPAAKLSHRRIHFHLPWLIELVRSIAANAETAIEKRPLPQPAKWLVRG